MTSWDLRDYIVLFCLFMPEFNKSNMHPWDEMKRNREKVAIYWNVNTDDARCIAFKLPARVFSTQFPIFNATRNEKILYSSKREKDNHEGSSSLFIHIQTCKQLYQQWMYHAYVHINLLISIIMCKKKRHSNIHYS